MSMSSSRPLARRIIGVETEYGITCAPTTDGPPPMDADHAARELFEPVVQRSRSSNVFTRGGARLYLDVGSHPEFATAECDRLEDVLAQDRAGELVMADLVEQANAHLAASGVPGRIHLLKNNRDAEDNGFGCHENYLVRRRGDFWNDARTLVPHLVTRQILVGAGHIAADGDTGPAGDGLRGYVFSQRADQMWDAVSSATTRSRPIINTRDEALADSGAYRRMHVIVGDTNVAEPTTALKVGMTELLIHAIEDGLQIEDLALADPMRAIREVNADLSGSAAIELATGRMTSAVAMQRDIRERVLSRIPVSELDPMRAYVVDLWGRGLDAIASGDWSGIDTELDIAIKRKLLSSYCARSGATLADPRVARLELSYSEITADGLRDRMESAGLMRRLTTADAVRRAQTIAPATTRASLRGRIIAAAEDARADLSVDWVHVRLDESQTIPLSLQDPLATTDPRVDALIAQIDASSPTIPA